MKSIVSNEKLFNKIHEIWLGAGGFLVNLKKELSREEELKLLEDDLQKIGKEFFEGKKYISEEDEIYIHKIFNNTNFLRLSKMGKTDTDNSEEFRSKVTGLRIVTDAR